MRRVLSNQLKGVQHGNMNRSLNMSSVSSAAGSATSTMPSSTGVEEQGKWWKPELYKNTKYKHTRAPIKKGIVKPTRLDTLPRDVAIPVVGKQTWEAPYSNYKMDSLEFKKIRKACDIARDALDYAVSLTKPGVTTEYIDTLTHEYIVKKLRAYPSPLNFRGFPKSICTSVNEVICHGIPDDREILRGDIVNVDVSCYFDGFHGDTSRMVVIDENFADEESKKLVKVTQHILDTCIKSVGPGVPFTKVADIVESICEQHGYTTNQDFCGHGIGEFIHMRPLILHHRNSNPGAFYPGLVFTIEPIICEGSASCYVWPDSFTALTVDGGRSAQVEHTMVITNNGVEILT